ncbi:MAG: UDP-N-acetylmuramate dehydrogenase [Deltaproteobacteria bacterium]|nr:UDP-N-acetylmuramate dehydrogenase [Deltaproteobacteria bacterium]
MKEFSDIAGGSITSMHCGGIITKLYEVESIEELFRLLKRFNDFLVIGSGTNMIFSQNRLETPVITLGAAFEYIKLEDNETISVGAATGISKILAFCEKNGLSGIEFMAGIPGLLGGSITMNAGTKDRGILNKVDQVKLADKHGIHTLSADKIPFGYRTGGIPDRTVICEARFQLKKESETAVRKSIQSYLLKRMHQPGGYSCGCIFKNPSGTSAGRLIDKAGLKGVRIGGAKISEIHANYIINEGNATPADIIHLMDMIRYEVKQKFDIELAEEVRIVG